MRALASFSLQSAGLAVRCRIPADMSSFVEGGNLRRLDVLVLTRIVRAPPARRRGFHGLPVSAVRLSCGRPPLTAPHDFFSLSVSLYIAKMVALPLEDHLPRRIARPTHNETSVQARALDREVGHFRPPPPPPPKVGKRRQKTPCEPRERHPPRRDGAENVSPKDHLPARSRAELQC